MKTPSGVSVSIEQLKKSYDAEVKNFLREKQILAVILKSCVQEFSDCSLSDIAGKYIEGEPSVSSVCVDQNQDVEFPGAVQYTGSKIAGLSNEDKSIHEGLVTYDIRFAATAPKTGGHIKLIINIEAQRESRGQGYPIVKRGVYYCSRLISAQKNVEFSGMDYDGVKKVYSIWICQNVPKDREYSIVSYDIRERIITERYGLRAEPVENYDLMSVVLMGLGNPEVEDTDAALRLLSTAFSEDVDADTKKRILSEKFGISMTEDIEGTVDRMCNLSSGIEERAEARGIRQGIVRGLEQKTVESINNMIALGYPDSEISICLSVPVEKVTAARSLVSV